MARMRHFDKPLNLRQAFRPNYIRQNAETALWVFLSPLSGLWWAFGKVYPLFDPFYGGRHYIFGERGRRLAEQAKQQLTKVLAKHEPSCALRRPPPIGACDCGFFESATDTHP